ncbi:hypothetical protein D3C73_1575430 [compost metagenome]
MAQRNCTAVNVNLAAVPIQRFADRQRLGGKGFVGFDQINVIQRPPGALQALQRGFHRADPHNGWINARDGVTGDFCQHRKV